MRASTRSRGSVLHYQKGSIDADGERRGDAHLMLRDTRRCRRAATRRQLLVVVALATLIGLAGALAWPLAYQGRLYPGVHVLGLDLGGMPRAEAAAALAQRLAPYERQTVTFHLQDQTWTASLQELGVRFDVASTLDRACRHGHRDGILTRYAILFDPSATAIPVPVVATVEQTKLDGWLAGLAHEASRAPKAARLVVNGEQIAIRQGTDGAQVDRVAARRAVFNAIEQMIPLDATVPTRPVPPAVAPADLERARAAADTMLAGPVTISSDAGTWGVKPADLAHALVVPPDPATLPHFDLKKLRATLAPIAEMVDRSPRNATVAWDDGLYAASDGAPGRRVDLDRLARDVAQAAAARSPRTVALPLVSVAPEVDAAHLDRLAITTRLARGSSSFAGSSGARATNVAVAARHLTGTLIPPGGTFSFNDALGPITTDAGFVEGRIIAGDWYASDLGGGVCQVSTTVYRAALRAGLPFTEWHPHSFRLGFYELDGWPPGLDAAIYQPNNDGEEALDLRFMNPTDAWMLLQLSVEGDQLVADLYGAPTGYAVTISDPDMGPPIPAPPPVERESADLPSGEREQIQSAHPGVVVSVERTVVKDGETIADDTFVSDYRPQADVYVVGTGKKS